MAISKVLGVPSVSLIGELGENPIMDGAAVDVGVDVAIAFAVSFTVAFAVAFTVVGVAVVVTFVTFAVVVVFTVAVTFGVAITFAVAVEVAVFSGFAGVAADARIVPGTATIAVILLRLVPDRYPADAYTAPRIINTEITPLTPLLIIIFPESLLIFI